MWPGFAALALLVLVVVGTAGQALSPAVNASTWDEIFAAVQGNASAIRIVSHVSFLNAPDAINVTNVPLAVFRDTEACSASAGSLVRFLFFARKPCEPIN